MPYLVPPWLMRSIGTRTMRLPRKIVMIAWVHDIPSAIRPEASSQLGMLIDIPTQRAR